MLLLGIYYQAYGSRVQVNWPLFVANLLRRKLTIIVVAVVVVSQAHVVIIIHVRCCFSRLI